MAKYLNEEVPVTACGLQETGVNPLRLRFYKVKHRVHFARVWEQAKGHKKSVDQYIYAHRP